ncbi:unnamed protein product [Paramecium sonneborni]|uniref:Uncharacterized protein n=1 Tax=Paramecium sonneborni TaxID=65129 RepID=A0A8S1QSI5_9CILI|nr:unnamed protein product [Paramecium sonneborni]
MKQKVIYLNQNIHFIYKQFNQEINIEKMIKKQKKQN